MQNRYLCTKDIIKMFTYWGKQFTKPIAFGLKFLNCSRFIKIINFEKIIANISEPYTLLYLRQIYLSQDFNSQFKYMFATLKLVIVYN